MIEYGLFNNRLLDKNIEETLCVNFVNLCFAMYTLICILYIGSTSHPHADNIYYNKSDIITACCAHNNVRVTECDIADRPD